MRAALSSNGIELSGTTVTNSSASVVLAAGGIAAEPDLNTLPVRDGGTQSSSRLRYGAGIVALAAPVAAGWWVARRRRRNAGRAP